MTSAGIMSIDPLQRGLWVNPPQGNKPKDFLWYFSWSLDAHRSCPASASAEVSRQFRPLLAPVESGTTFGITPASLDAVCGKARNRAVTKDGTFQDTRHLAITRLARKVNVLDLVRMVGHRDPRQLQVYYNESAEDIASTKLTGKR